MAESHSKGEGRYRPVRPVATDVTGGPSALARASDGRPFRPYAYGGGEPPAVTAARERHQAVSARIEAACAALDAREAGNG